MIHPRNNPAHLREESPPNVICSYPMRRLFLFCHDLTLLGNKNEVLPNKIDAYPKDLDLV